jgi:hypothetical protein
VPQRWSGLLDGAATLEPAEPFVLASGLGCHRLERGADLADLDGQRGGGGTGAMAVDDGTKLGAAVERPRG